MRKPQFKAKDICDAAGGEFFSGSPETVAAGVSVDTRTIGRGEAFFALCGPNHDGHDHMRAAAESGARIIVAQKGCRREQLPSDTCVILVDDTLDAMCSLAGRHRKRLGGKVIAITGSCGKSTVKEMTGAILAEAGECTLAPASYNNRIGVSLTLLGASVDDDFVILELGANRGGEIDELARFARPDIGCITCIGECHLEGFGSLEGVREAKAEIIPHITRDGLLVLNGDDPGCCALVDRFEGEVKTYGVSEDVDVGVKELKSGAKGELFGIEDVVFHLPLTGRHNVLNAAAAVCIARHAGATFHQALQALCRVRPPQLRWEERSIGGVDFVLDCYNSNPTAMRAACEAFTRIDAGGRRIIVCGDMLELGAYAARLHENTGRMIARRGIDMLIAVGDNAEHTVRGWRSASSKPQNALSLPDKDKVWLFLYRLAGPGDVVMVKGSNKMRMEEIVDSIDEYVAGLEQEAA